MKFESKNPRFLIINAEPLPDQILKIPKKSLNKFGDELGRMVMIKVPNGEGWEVEFNKSDCHFWLQRGWKSFADHYSLDYPHCLSFRYNGNRGFDLFIIDKSATEIMYPVNKEHFPDSDDDDLIEIDEKGGGSSTPVQNMDSASLNSSFQAVMQEYNVNRSYLYVPTSFKECARLKDGQYVTLKCDGKSWHVKFTSRRGSGYLSAGWAAFRNENLLEEGDLYNFKLIKTGGDDIVIKVSISRPGN